MFPPNVPGKKPQVFSVTAWGNALRLSIGFLVVPAGVVAALAAAVAPAAAQYYPQPAGAYPPPYAAARPVYRDASGVPYDPRYVRPVPGEAGYDDGYYAPQPMPRVDGQAVERPPAYVTGAPASADVTGSVRPPASTGQPMVAGLPPEDQPEQGPTKELPPQFRRQIVDYRTVEPAGTIVIDTPHTYLYLVLGNGKALRYGVGVGREGFTWTGTQRVTRMKEWPDWFPPKEMIARQPYLPRFMAGGETNPLGARALYLGSTEYRIHGTNQPSTIGSFVSSGCIRLTNADIEDLYSRVGVGTLVVVMPGSPMAQSAQASPIPR